MTEFEPNDPDQNDDLGPDEVMNDDLPTRNDPGLRASIDLKKRILRDILGAVVDGDLTSVQIAGAAGVGKTRLCQDYLATRGISVVECRAYQTTAKVVDKLRNDPDKVFLFDDVSGCTKDEKFFSILLEATGPANPKTGKRAVHYETKKGTNAFDFSGRFVFVSNKMFTGAPRETLEALTSRLNVHRYELSHDEIEAEVYSIAAAGVGSVSADEALRVATWLLRECRLAHRTPSIRLFVDQAIPIFVSWKKGRMECSWEQHLAVRVRNGSTESLSSPGLSAEQRDAERLRIVVQIVAQHPPGPLRIQAWYEATGLSQPTYYRYLSRLNGRDDQPRAA